MNFDCGDIVLIRYPYTDQTSYKKRPAVVVSSTAYHAALPDIVLMPITSQIRNPLRFGEVPLQDWQSTGLLRASVIKPLFATTDKTLVIRQLGKLSVSDQKAVITAIKALLG